MGSMGGIAGFDWTLWVGSIGGMPGFDWGWTSWVRSGGKGTETQGRREGKEKPGPTRVAKHVVAPSPLERKEKAQPRRGPRKKRG